MPSAVISVQRPEWVNVWDTDSAGGSPPVKVCWSVVNWHKANELFAAATA